MSPIRVASAAWPIELLDSWETWEAKVKKWVEEAAGNEAKILLFPEYGSLELSGLFPEKTAKDPGACIQLMQEFWPAWRGLWAHLARQFSCVIAAPSFPFLKQGKLKNRVLILSPNGEERYQDKLVLTPFEKEWGIHPGDSLKVFAESGMVMGIDICYDSEFPILARRKAEAGMQLLLVPSNTETEQGYHRVQVGARARALENQCFVVHSVTVGAAPWSGLIEDNKGAAAIYGPIDPIFSQDGVMARGKMDQATWVFADLDFEKLEDVRRSGQVHNFRDWQESVKDFPLQ